MTHVCSMVAVIVLQHLMHQATKQKYPHLICTTLGLSPLTTLGQMLTVTQITVPLTNWDLQVKDEGPVLYTVGL